MTTTTSNSSSSSSSSKTSNKPSSTPNDIRVEEKVISVLEWPTDTFSIDYYCNNEKQTPHTVIVFVPGNPGLIGWYIPFITELVKACGKGFAARGISYAGHGVTSDITNVEQWENNKNTSIPWTVEGQVWHKIAYLDLLKTDGAKFIFLGHSIGCHMIQQFLILRPDLLAQTTLILHMMPFIRMDAHPWTQQYFMTTGAARPQFLIRLATNILTTLSKLPEEQVDFLFRTDIACPTSRKIAVDLVRQPSFGRNFFELGTQEIRDVPEIPDVAALRIIGAQCQTSILFVANDKWAPTFHMTDLKQLQQKGVIPANIDMTYLPHLVHEFVVRPAMVEDVLQFCLNSIQEHAKFQTKDKNMTVKLQSKL